MGTLKIVNEWTRKIMEKINILLEFCIPEISQQNKWIFATSNYNEGMRILRKKEDYTTDDINIFQLKIDDF